MSYALEFVGLTAMAFFAGWGFVDCILSLRDR